MKGRVGVLHHNYGKKWTLEARQRASKAHTGQKVSLETRKKMSAARAGFKHSEATKLKLRLAKLARCITLGIPTGEDKGAREWFDGYNKVTGSNFTPRTFAEIGYSADGYDQNKHAWIEYDTTYHRKPTVKAKDIVRQQNIINYFNKIGNPLSAFIRVLAYDNNKLVEVFRNN
jgi:hypothetical protein